MFRTERQCPNVGKNNKGGLD